MMFDNQITIKPRVQEPEPQPQPEAAQAKQQLEVPPEVIEQINYFRMQQAYAQKDMMEAITSFRSGASNQEQFDVKRQEIQNKQQAMMEQMNAFQAKYEPILKQMAQGQAQVRGQHSHSHNGRPCNHDHGHDQGHQHGGQGHQHNGQGQNHRHEHGGHDHNHSHGGHEHSHSIQCNPFANVPPSMRVFAFYAILNGDFIFSIFMSLPLMPMGYQFYAQIKQMISMPLFIANNLLNQKIGTIDSQAVKTIFGGLGIFYLIFHYFVYWMFLSPRFDALVDRDWYKQLIQFTLLSLFISILFTVFVSPGHLDTPENRKKFEQIISERPEYQFVRKKATCLLCDVPKVVRAFHCIYTKKCIMRYENHSLMLNVPIGVYNNIFYIWYMFSLTSYFAIIIYGFTLPTRGIFQKSLFDLIILLINIQQLNYFGSSFLLHLMKISYNITQSELSSWRRNTYLWKNERGEFFNPFDRGLVKNWYTIILPWVNRILRREWDPESEIVDWSQAKILSIMDIKDHPMGARVAEQFGRRPPVQKSQTEEKQGLLQGENA